jgi:DNA-binding transcriptional regulator YiaG
MSKQPKWNASTVRQLRRRASVLNGGAEVAQEVFARLLSEVAPNGYISTGAVASWEQERSLPTDYNAVMALNELEDKLAAAERASR